MDRGNGTFAAGEGRTLAEFALGDRARIAALSCEGPTRRRLLDLGFLPGTDVEVVMESPAGDLTAYRIRGATIALRTDQARQIAIE
ncbi:MAG: ferrous iron transport protein A [Nitrospinota bacterium]